MIDEESIAEGAIRIDTVIDGQLAERNMRIGNEDLEFSHIDLVQINSKEHPNDLRTSIFFNRKKDNRQIEIRIYSSEISLVVAKEQPVWDLITDGCAEVGAAYDDGK